MENLTSGEKAALARGNDVITKPQLAALYLFAKEMVKRSEDNRGRGDNVLTRNALKMNANTTMDDFQKLPSTKLADVLGLKSRTVSRTISKFKMIFNGNRQGTPSESIAPKYLNSFDEFSSMQVSQVLTMANEAINLQAEPIHEIEEKQKKESNAKNLSLIKSDIVTTYSTFKRKFLPMLAAKMTINAISQRHSMKEKDVKQLAFKIFKLDQLTVKYFAKS